MSLKKRIVAWYTLWTLTLMAIIFLLFFSFSNTLSLRSLRHDVEEALSDASSLIRVRSGRLNFFSVDEVEDGIYILVFSSDGTLLFGREGIGAVSIGYQEGQRTLSLPDGHWIISDMMMDGYYIRAAARESTIYSMISSDYLLVLIAALVMVAISALGGYFIVSRAFLPLERLISTASEIADGDDLTKRLESSNAKESRELSSAFNSMLGRLDDSFKKEKEFTDDASHELRTPLAVIKAESEYALGSIDDRTEVEQSLSAIIKETDRMTRLISSLLELSRVDKGSIKINKSRFSLSSMLEGLSEEMSQMARERNLSFSSTLEEGIFVYADEDMIIRSVINLINNAISYSKENGHIDLLLKRNDSVAIISVKDDGIGISEEDQKRIFDRFFQVDKARSSSSSGLGLALVKEMAALNNATINVESKLGYGSVFTLSIPIA